MVVVCLVVKVDVVSCVVVEVKAGDIVVKSTWLSQLASLVVVDVVEEVDVIGFCVVVQ